MSNTIITSTGSYVPGNKVLNNYYSTNIIFDSDGKKPERSNNGIIDKSKEITCIDESRDIPDDLAKSDMAFQAAENALKNTDRESLDYIIVGQNFGDIGSYTTQDSMLPSIAANVKHKLKIKNPYTVAFDVLFGCPGCLQNIILADYYIKSGAAKKILVIGAEMLLRVSDPHDIDSMIYADGAGATLVEATDQNAGILSHGSRSDNPKRNGSDLSATMFEHDIYTYAVKTVPGLVRQCLNKIGLSLRDVKKIFIQQANKKMGEDILKQLFKLYQEKNIPQDMMPMIISNFGDSSVATLPTLFDLIARRNLDSHELKAGDVTVFASIGAGMNTNAIVYRVP